MHYFIGTAGWTIPKQHSLRFSAEGSHLQRCAERFDCVEVNSSFHRSHMRKTWERWADTTPDTFRFAVKIPKAITHVAKLINTGALLQSFLVEVAGLNAGRSPKLGPLLVQLPPKLEFDAGVTHEFFTALRELHTGHVVCEPRHESWFAASADRMLREFEIARAAADPPKGSLLAAGPGGWPGLRYWRLHGAPRTYYSAYSPDHLKQLAQRVRSTTSQSSAEVWVIFDNTALGHATENALQLAELLR